MCTIDKEFNFCKLIGKKNTETKLSWNPTLFDRHDILILHDTLVLHFHYNTPVYECGSETYAVINKLNLIIINTIFKPILLYGIIV